MSPIRFLLTRFTGIFGYLGLIALRRAYPDAVGLLVGARDVIRPLAPGIAAQLQGYLDTSSREKP